MIGSMSAGALLAALSLTTGAHADEVSADALENIPFRAVDRSVAEHAHETRGFVPVALDYAKPDGRQLEIFYRLIPSALGKDAPLLIFMNGGPGVSASQYRSLEFDYDGGDTDVLSELAKHFRILAVDQRGTGHSAPLDLDDPALSADVIARLFDSDEHARDHARVIEHVVPEGERFFVLAQSYGGEIGFQYLTLPGDRQWPAGIVFSSAVLPHTDVLETFVHRRLKQRELNLKLREGFPELVAKLQRLRRHLESLGIEADAVNFLWTYLGKNAVWERELPEQIDALVAIRDGMKLENALGHDIRHSVNLLNYVLSSAALTGGYTDRTLTVETSRRVPFEDWMLDENWTLRQIGNDGTWREAFVAGVDRKPPPPRSFPPVEEIRSALGEVQALFTFGNSDAFLPMRLQLPRARRFEVPGHTAFRVLEGGHGVVFSAVGAATVSDWARRVLETGSNPKQ